MLDAIPDGSRVVDANRSDFVDHDIEQAIGSFVADAAHRRIVVEVRGMPGERRKGRAGASRVRPVIIDMPASEAPPWLPDIPGAPPSTPGRDPATES